MISTIFKYIIIIFSTLSIKACGIFTDHEREIIRPQIDVNWQYFQYDDIIKNNKTSIVNIKYQKFFLNPEIIATIDLALDNNKDFKIATLKAKSAYDYYRVERADLFPKISAEASTSRQKVSSNSLNRFGANFGSSNSFIVNNYEANLATASFELDLFNKINYINEAAFNNFLSKIETQNAVRIALIGQTANSYINYQANSSINKIAKKILEAEEEKFKLVNSSYISGLTSKEEMLRANNRLQNTMSDYAAFDKATKQDKNLLINILGVENDNKIKSLEFDKISLNKDSFIDLSSEILLFRPDIVASEFQLYSMDANIKVARASYFPSISLTGSYGFVSNNLSTLISNENSSTWNTGAGINIPIFSAFKNSANLARRKAERQIALENYQKTIQNAFKEVADLLSERKFSKINLEKRQKIFTSSLEISKKEQKFFEIGTKNKLDYLTSYQQHLQNEMELIIAKKNQLNSQINLYKAFGAGMVSNRISATALPVQEISQKDP